MFLVVYSSDYDNIAISAVLDICEDGTYNGDAGTYNAKSFDATSNTDPLLKQIQIYLPASTIFKGLQPRLVHRLQEHL